MKVKSRIIAAMDRDLPDYDDTVLKIVEVGTEVELVDDYHFKLQNDSRIFWILPSYPYPRPIYF